LTLELGSRLAVPVAFPDPLITEARSDWELTREYDPLLFWRMQPGIERDGETLTNSLGLRGPEVEPKRPDEFRILSLGESTTFGIRLPYDETYSARLEAALGGLSNRPVRVVNAGVPGYSLFQGVTYLKYRGIGLEPNAVIVYFGYNDFLPVAYRRDRDVAAGWPGGGASDRELFESRSALSFRSIYAVAEHSNLARYLLFGGQSDRAVVADNSRPRVPGRDRRQLLTELRDFSDEHGLRLAIVIPWYREFEDHAPLLREFAAARKVLVVDLPRELESLPRPRPDYFVDSIHPSSEGHELIAGVLADQLVHAWGLDGSGE